MSDRKQHLDLCFQGRRGTLFHPVTLFLVSWSIVVGLYSLHLSELLLFETRRVVLAALWVVVPFVITVWWAMAFSSLAPKRKVTSPGLRLDIPRIEKRLRVAFWIWAVFTTFEVFISGGIPIIWLIRGSSKTYADFGIPSIHGLLNSLILGIGLVEAGLFALDRQKRHLWIPAWIIVWSTLAVTRNMMIVSLLEGGIAWGMMRGVRWRTVLKTVGAIAVVTCVFGYIGDFRSGAEAFRYLAQPSSEYPNWLPSGVLWIYIYLTTSVGNLVNTMTVATPLGSPLFPNTMALLFPSVIRKVIYGVDAASGALSGELVTDAFNVSTAYVGPYQDFGLLGIVLFSILLGITALYFWKMSGVRGALMYSVIGQCLVLSIFFNHLFYLPVISQLGWIMLFFWRDRTVHTIEEGAK